MPKRSSTIGLTLVAILAGWTPGCESMPACRGPADCPSGSLCLDGRCRFPSTDRDGDGLPDTLDPCPDLDPGEDLWKAQLADRDGDGVGDLCDVCPEVRDPDQRDADGDGRGDACPEALQEDESANDSPARLVRLPFDADLDGFIGLPAGGPDRDLYWFAADEGEMLSFSARPWPDDSLCDPVIAVRDLATFGEEFLRAADDDGESRAARLDILAPRSGEYLLEIGHFSNWISADEPVGGIRYGYRLRAHRGRPAEEIWNLPERRVLRIAPGELRSLLIRPDPPTLFEASARGAGLTDPELVAEDAASGRILAWQDDRPDCPGSKDARMLLCPSDSMVRLVVGHLGLGGAPADIEISLNPAGPWPAPGQISRMNPSSATLLAAGAMTGPRRFRVESRGGFSPALYAWACGASPVPDQPGRCEFGSPSECALGFYAEADTRLFLEVAERAAPGCQPPVAESLFSLAELTSPVEPAELEPGTGEIELAPGQMRVFSIQALAGERLHFETIAQSAGARPWLQLRRQDGTLLSRSAPGEGNPDSTSRIVWIHPIAEELRLFVGDGQNLAGRLRLDHARELPDLPRLAEGAITNDTLDQAEDPGAPPFLLRGAVGGQDPADVFRLRVPAGWTLVVRTWAGDPEPADTVLSLFDAGGRALAWSDDAEGNRLARLPPLAVARAEEFFVRIEARRHTAYLLEAPLGVLDWRAPVPPRHGDLLINEALILPGADDINGDGSIDDGDQYLEIASRSSLPLRLDDTWLATRRGWYRFPPQTVLEPEEVILVFNAPAASGLFAVRVFDRGSRQTWLEAGFDSIRIVQNSEAGWLPEPIASADLPSTAAPGESQNRLRDLDPERILRPHRFVVGSLGICSPGRRADGGEFVR